MTDETQDTAIEQLGEDWMDRIFLYRCKECGAMYDSGGGVIRHISNEHLPWMNWPWKDTSGPITDRYIVIEVNDCEVIPDYAE